MLRQPTWHRILAELKADWKIRQLLAIRSPKGVDQGTSLRVGIVGLGRVARRHALGYLQTKDTLLVAGSDPASKARTKAARRFGLKHTYATTEAMLAAENLDMVSICSPPRFHAQDVKAAVAAGVKAILCEKPLGLNLAEADAMIQVCQDHGVILATNHQRRFGPQHVMAHDILRQGKLGAVRFLYADCPRDILRSGIHVADMLNDYLGRASRVTASLSNGQGGATRALDAAVTSGETTDKESTILVEYANGPNALLRVENRSGLDAKLRFLCEGGTLEVWWDGGLRYRRNGDSQWTQPTLNLNPYLDDFRLSVASVISALKENLPAAISGMDGRNSLELTLAIIRANDEGKTVEIPAGINVALSHGLNQARQRT